MECAGYGRSPTAEGEDFLVDAEDIAELMGDGAHLVGHSYGGLGVLWAAARRPDATLSLTLLEPGAFSLGQRDPAARTLLADVRRLWDQDLPNGDWVIRFLRIVGSDPDALSPELVAAAVPLVPVLRCGRPIWEPELPLDAVASAAFPKLVVSGGHSAGFDAICDEVAERIGASRMVIEGAGHEIQFTGGPLNEALRTLWRAARSSSAQSSSPWHDSSGRLMAGPADNAGRTINHLRKNCSSTRAKQRAFFTLCNERGR
jgi:pimeloyl-ACP methyl ester carboxylesterase